MALALSGTCIDKSRLDGNFHLARNYPILIFVDWLRWYGINVIILYEEGLMGLRDEAD